MDGSVVTRYIGIVQVPDGPNVAKMGGGVDRPPTPANKNRFSRNYSEFRVGHTDSESSFLASLNWYRIAAERDRTIVYCSSVRCSKCGNEFSVESYRRPGHGPHYALPSVSCPKLRRRRHP